VTTELFLPQGMVCFKIKESAIPDFASNVKNVSGLKLCWTLQRAEEHVHDSRTYGMGNSGVPLTICPNVSLRIRLTLMRLIIGIMLKEETPKATVSYGDVAMSFPYAYAELLAISIALKDDEEVGNPIDLFSKMAQYSSKSLHSRNMAPPDPGSHKKTQLSIISIWSTDTIFITGAQE
jgi:hypothetical protein